MERQKTWTITKRVSRLRVIFPTDMYKKWEYDYDLVIDYYFENSSCGLEIVIELFYLINKKNGDIVSLKAKTYNYK